MAKRNTAVSSDIYTAILALAFLALLAATVFVTYKCGSQYGWSSLFEIVSLRP
jgi:hypothetical protein